MKKRVLRAIITENVIFWNVTPSCFVDIYQLRGICRFHLQDRIQFKAQTILKLRGDGVHYLEDGDGGFSETSLHNYQNKRRHTPQLSDG